MNPSIPSLRSIALHKCILNANNIASVGDLPYLLIKPILQACSAAQLLSLETQSPHLIEDTQDLWRRHVSERFPTYTGAAYDGDWRGLYERLKAEEVRKLESASARLREKNGVLRREKEAKRIVVIEQPKRLPLGAGVRKRFSVAQQGVGSPQKKKNSLLEKARRDTSISKLNYAGATPFGKSPTVGRLGRTVNGMVKPKREPAPPNDRNVFGRLFESPKVRPDLP
jgi:RNA polymerase II transcription factor SIII (Elongin) subunit A